MRMSERQAQPFPQPRSEMSPIIQSLLGLLVSAVVLWIGLYGAVIGTFIGGWSLGPVALAIPVVMVALMTAAHSAVAFRVTGKRRIGASFLIVSAACVLIAVWFFQAGTIPILWLVPPGVDAAFPIVALVGALTFGLILGPTPLRIVGVIAAAALLTTVVAVPVIGQMREREAQAARDEQAAREAQVQRLANFEQFILDGTHPMTLDAATPMVTGYDLEGAGRTFVVTDGGGAVLVAIYDWNETADPLRRCTALGGPGQQLTTDTLEDFAEWCRVSGDDAALVDGTGLSQIRGDRLVTVSAMLFPREVEEWGATRPANATEVREIFDALRPMTEAELREEFAPKG